MIFSKNLVKNYSDKWWGKLKSFLKKNYQPKYILTDRKFFKWQFFENPENFYKSAAFKILVIKKQILGHLGIIPVRLKINNSKIKGAIICNLLADREFRGLGLGVQLLKSAIADFPVLIGTGYTPATTQIYKKMDNWKIMAELSRYIKVINYKKIGNLIGAKIKKNKKNATSIKKSNFYIRKIKMFDRLFDVFWQKAAKRYPVTIERKANYLNWRYAKHPSFNYQIRAAYKNNNEISGYIIFRVAKSEGGKVVYRIGYILDLVAINDEAASILVWQAEKEMVKNKVDFIDYSSSGLFHRKIFLSLGYGLNDKFPLNLIPMHFNPIEMKKPKRLNFFLYYGGSMRNKNKLCNVNNWYLTKGDGDKDRPNPH